MPVLEGFTPHGLPAEPAAAGPMKGFKPTIMSPEDGHSARTVLGTAGDIGVSALKGAVGLPQAFVGLADIPTGGHVGRFLEDNLGYRPAETQAFLDTLYSDAQQEANQRVQEAEGFLPTLKAALQNPSVIGHTAIESAPSMLGGSGIARGAMKVLPKLAPWAAGALGEGAVTAGQIAEQIRGENDDRLLTGKQALASAAAGLGTGAIGAFSGRLANRLGIGDIETELASGKFAGDGKKGLFRNIGSSMLSEGVLEELPQSAQEQMWQNWAQGKDLMQGVGNQAAMGMLAGAGMGVTAGALHHRGRPTDMLGTGNPSPQDAVAPVADLLGQEHAVGAYSPLTPSTQEDHSETIAVLDDQLFRATALMAQAAKQGNHAEFYRFQDIVNQLQQERDKYRPIESNAATPDTQTGDLFTTPKVADTTEPAAPTTAPSATSASIAQDIADAANDDGLTLTTKKGQPIGERVDLYTKSLELKAVGAIDAATHSQTVIALSKGRYGEVKAVLTQADKDFTAKKAAAQGATNVSQSSAPAAAVAPSSVGGGAVNEGSVGAARPVSAVNEQVGGAAENPGAPAGQAPVLAKPRVQRSTAVGTDTTVRPGGLLDDATQNSIDVLRETGQGTDRAALADTVEKELTGQRADLEQLTDEQKQAVLDERFKNSTDPKRDQQVLEAYHVALRAAPHNERTNLHQTIGDDFGLAASSVRRIGNPSDLVRVGAKLGFSKEQIEDAFGVVQGKDKSAAAPKTSEAPAEAAPANDSAQLRKALATVQSQIAEAKKDPERVELRAQLKALDDEVRAAGGTMSDDTAQQRADLMEKLQSKAEAQFKLEDRAKSLQEMLATRDEGSMGGEGEGEGSSAEPDEHVLTDDSRIWHRDSSTGDPAASKMVAIQEKIEKLNETIQQLEAAGASKTAEHLRGLIEAETVRVQQLVDRTNQKLESELGPKKAEAPKREIGADLAAAKQKFKDAKYDPSKMTTDELKLLRGEAQRFNNKAMLDKIDAQLEASGEAATKVAAKEEPKVDVRTTEEQARDAWDKEALSYDNAPMFDSLPEEVQQRWVEYGPENWNASDVATELARIQKEQGASGDYASQSGESTYFKSSIGPGYHATPANLIDLIDHDGVRHAVSLLHKNGMSHALKSVANWFTTGDAHVNWDGLFTMVNGKPSVVLSRLATRLPHKAAVTVLHEVGHAIDMPGASAKFSNAPTLGLRLVGNEIMPMRPGSVVDELLNHFQDEPDSALSELMQYPLNREVHGKFNQQQVRAEVFAQLWAFSNLQGGMDVLRSTVPATAAFMEKVHAEVKGTEYTQASYDQGDQPRQDSRRAEAGQDAYASRSTATPRIAKEEVGHVTSLLKSYAASALNKVVFTEDLFARAVAHGMASAKTMHRIYQERARMVGETLSKVSKIEQLYNRIPRSEHGTGERSANKFLYDSTREGKWGFEPDWRSGASAKVTVDPAIAARWNALSPQAREWISAVLKHGDEMLATKKQTLMDATRSEYDALIAAAKADGNDKKVAAYERDKQSQLKQFARLFGQQEFIPYAPMKRFGDFVVIAKSATYLAAEKAGNAAEIARLEKDPDHYQVSFAESRGAAMELQRELAEQFKDGTVASRAKEEARGDMYNGLLESFTKLRAQVDEQLALQPDSAEKAALTKAREMLADMYLRSLSENSARKSEMRRRGVAGEIDMLRSFTTQGRADAHFLAAAKYNPQTAEAINKLRQESKQGGDQLAKSDIFKEIQARHTDSLTFKDTPLQDRMARATSLWMLATSPGYYLQNLTQPFMLSVPFMAGRHNYLKSVGALTRAYSQLAGLFKDYKVNEAFDYSKLPTDVRSAIETLAKRGRIDIGMDTELGNARIEGNTKLAEAGKKVDQVLRVTAQKMEAVNRISTAMAAYRMELAKTGDAKAALEYADAVISQTHGDYTRINAPRAFNTGVGKLALQFRKYQLIQLTLLTKMVKNSINAADPAERLAARKALGFTLAHTGVMTGLVGMPGFAAIAFIIGKLADLFGDDDEPYNLEKELRAAIGDQDVANLLLRGTPTLANVDVSSKIGMGNALSVLPFTDFEASSKGVGELFAAAVGGASLSLVGREADAVKLLMNGDYYRGIEKALPKGLSDGMKAYREATDGVTRTNGDVLMQPEEVTAWETFQKTLGFSPSTETQRRFDQNVKYEVTTAFKDRADKLKNQFAKAKREGDTEAMSAIRDKWARLQASRVEEGFQREPLSKLLAAPARQAQRERQTVQGIQFDKNTRRFVQNLAAE